jgi:hypothetical protein
MLEGIGNGNMLFNISPISEIAKMIRNCFKNFIFVSPQKN